MSSFITSNEVGKMLGGYSPPEIWFFKPLYTLQPVSETREKQLKAWREIVLAYCQHSKQSILFLDSCPLFKNESIGRSLSSEGIRALGDSLVKHGYAEKEDGGGLRIIWKPIDELASDIYSWATRNDLINNVCTIYELYASEEYSDSGFYGMDPFMIRRALSHLETTRHKCIIIPGSVSDEDGVKFL